MGAISAMMATMAVAQAPIRAPLRRARPPEWSPRETAGVFFEDAFQQGLTGPRPMGPDSGRAAAAEQSPAVPQDTHSVASFPWSEMVSAETLEDEVKALKLAIDRAVTTPGEFAQEGHLAARRDFSMLALVFAVIGEYDGDVRWKKDAAAARDRFARAASICKAGSPGAFQAAKERKADLQDLVGGARLRQWTGGQVENWGQVADRAPLMERLEAAHQRRLRDWTSNSRELAANKARIRHEAEVIAVIAEALTKEGMDDGEDDDYAGHCERMKRFALEIINSIELGQVDNVPRATGEIGKACSDCHEFYRG